MAKAGAAAVVPEVVAGDVVPKAGKKKLIIILAAVLLLALAGGGAALYVVKKKAAEAAAAAEEDDAELADGETTAAKPRDASRAPPVFVPLEPFVVNLADRESDRFAQVGVTLELEDPKFAEEMKLYMPAIRNGILMVLSHKTSAQLLSREGKQALAREIMREAVLPMGIEVAQDEGDDPAVDADGEPLRKKRRSKNAQPNPVKRVHFSNFIVQ